MEYEELKDTILEANRAYRSGNPIMNDSDYDVLVEKFQYDYPEEYESFRNTLNEGTIELGDKIRHKYIAGSLNKLKHEEPETIISYLKKTIRNKLSVSAKVDGISGILHYVNGNLVCMATRGDGSEGLNITEKARHINGIPQTIKNKNELYIRGELVILKKNYGNINGTSARNVCAGLINRKEYDEKELNLVDFIAYTIMGPEYCKVSQFEELEYNGFNTAWHINIDVEDCQKEDIVNELFSYATQDFDYQTDGLVLSDTEYRNEEKYRPDNQISYKTNQQSFITRLIDVEWQGPSKNGAYSPVGILESCDCGGVIVSRCTLHNIDFIREKNVRYGDMVKIIRSGDVIPKLIEVVSSNDNSRDIEYPTHCICCGSELVKEGPFLYCKNNECSDKTTYEIQSFFKNLNIENASFKTLQNFGIHNIRNLLNFKANPKYRNETKLENELKTKMFSISEKDIFCALNMKDLGMKTLNVIVKHYGWDYIKTNKIDSDTLTNLPENIGDITMNKFLESYKKNLCYVDMIVSDPRYHYVETSDITEKTDTEIKGSICVTGSINNFKNRDEFLKTAMDYGYESKSSVTKGLTYLVNNDINSNSSKNTKAKKLGIPIISEDDFLNIIGFLKNDEL